MYLLFADVTLILESAIHEFELAEAKLVTPTTEELTTTDPVEFSFETIHRFAGQYESLTPTEHPNWTCLPLHGQERAALTGSYVAYTDHPIRGEIIVYADADDGTETSLPLKEFVRTPLARRLRFWHPDYIPETYPDYYRAPFDDKEPPQNTINPDAFFDDIASYLTDERAAALADRERNLTDTSPRDVYERGGDALPALRSTQVSDAGTTTLTIDFSRLEDLSERVATRRHRVVTDEFGIYPDDPVLLIPPNRDHAPDAFPIRATVTDIASTRITVKPAWEQIDKIGVVRRYLAAERVGYGVIKLLNPLPYNRRKQAIERVRNKTTFREVLSGQRALTFTQPRTARSSKKDPELNQEQQAAVKYALLADDLFCIHGPPGTGKTRTLVEIVRRAVEAGESVLVCADSNQAVDNILVGESTPTEPDRGSLHAFGQHGTGEYVLDRRNVSQSARDTVAEWYKRTPGSADVVAATNGSAARIERRFDLVVIDEATQATIATSTIPLSKASTVILAGDHRQLPPFSKTESPPSSSAGLSLFEHIYTEDGVFEDVGLQLRTQYRMHRDIAYFPNREFYDRALQTGVDIAPVGEHPPIVGYNIGGTEHSRGTSYANNEEAVLIGTLIDRIQDEDIPPAEIGVITPYAAQTTQIEETLTNADGIKNQESITIDTIDAFQGSERTVIIISFVRSNPDGEIGFLGRASDGPRRLNVAMTRAQRLCMLVGDWTTLKRAAERSDSADQYEALHSLLEDTGRMREVDPTFLSL